MLRTSVLPTIHPLSRRALAAGFLLLAAGVRAQAACPPPKVLFVCPAGTVKSAIARETLKREAAKAGVSVEVRSRGLDPQDHVSPALKAKLAADEIDPAVEPVRRLADSDLGPGQIVVAFDEAAADPRLAGARVWDIPSWNDAYPAARAALALRIQGLVAELRAGAASCAP